MSKRTKLVNFYFTKEEMRQMMISYLVSKRETSACIINHISDEDNGFMMEFTNDDDVHEILFSFDGEIEDK